MLRFLTSGESHGPQLTVIIEGLPAGIPIDLADIQKEMQKRKLGSGNGGRQKIETDEVEIVSGVRHGLTLGSPITLVIKNRDFANWEKDMGKKKLTTPRPGHADLAGALKYDFDDVRNVLERASARETAARVAAGAIFKQFLALFDISISSRVLQIGPISMEKTNAKIAIEKLILETQKNKDTLGGVIEVSAKNVPVGLGSPVHWDRRIDGQLAQALMSIPSVKAVEIGAGIEAAALFGSQVHDPIQYKKGFIRPSNNAGGIEGGMTNGMPLILKVFHKPIATLYDPLPSVDLKTKKPALACIERSDICVIPRAGVISEAMVAFVLAKNFLEKFGCDSTQDIKASYKNYLKRLS